MKTRSFILAAALVLCSTSLSAQNYKWYGFIRNYYTLDTRECVSGTEDFFMYLPKDQALNANGDDLNAVTTFRFAALTSRIGLDVTGYEINGWNVGAKIEADFYAGVSGVTGTATMRLRQAFMTMAKNDLTLKMGQGWHPMAADMPDVISLNTGAPFGPFSRTPLVQADIKLSDAFTLTADAIWQMQYTSAGPKTTTGSADYIKYGCTPELYLGLSYKNEGFLGRVGVDVLSIKPRTVAGNVKVNDRITTMTPFAYAQYTKGDFALKAKTAYAQAGEHMSLNGGYGVSAVNSDGSWEYSATRNSSSWLSLKYGKKVQGVLFAGYVKNFGTKDALVGDLYFSKNSFSNMNQMWRLTPTIIYNMGKIALGAEYEVTSVQYGSFGLQDNHGLASQNLHWITNNRLQAMVKYTF